MKKPKPSVVAACGGALTSMAWLAGTWFDRYWWPYAFPWVPASVLIVLLVVSLLRREFGALGSYLTGLVSAIVTIPAALLLFGAFLLVLQVGVNEAQELADRVRRRPFVETEWREHGSDRTRVRLVDDLVASRRLQGLQRREVEALLGPPSGNHGSSEDELAYWLSTNRGWLCVRLKDGRAAGVGFAPYDD